MMTPANSQIRIPPYCFAFYGKELMLTFWSTLFSCATILSLSTIIRRWMFDELSKFPGPSIAAYTWLYRAYYDVVKSGGLLVQLEKLHKEYGPVVRIGPNEVSVAFSSSIYSYFVSFHASFTFSLHQPILIYTATEILARSPHYTILFRSMRHLSATSIDRMLLEGGSS